MPRRTNRFQQVVAIVERHLAGDEGVTESAMLTARRGKVEREVDVVLLRKIGQHTIRVSIEASKTSRPATIEWVEQMVAKHAKLPTDKLVLYSGRGFTRAALDEATASNAVAIGEEPLAAQEAKVLAGLRSLWAKMIQLTPEQSQIEARRPDGTTWRFGPPPDAMLFFEDGQRFPLDFAQTLSRKIRGQMRTIIDQINLRDIAQSLESVFVAELSPFSVKIRDVEHRFFVRCETPAGPELHEIVCVRVRGKAKIDVNRIALSHSQLGDVQVATGDFKLGQRSGLVVASSIGKLTMRFDPVTAKTPKSRTAKRPTAKTAKKPNRSPS
jgi:hypothetical protein